MTILLWLALCASTFVLGHMMAKFCGDDDLLAGDAGQVPPGTLKDLLAHGDIVRSGDRFKDSEVTR